MTNAFGFSGIILNGKSIQVKMGGHIKHPRKHVSWGLHSAKSLHISMCRTSNGSSLSPQRLHEETEILVQLGHGKGFPGVCCLPVRMTGPQQPTALHVIPRTQVLLLASL